MLASLYSVWSSPVLALIFISSATSRSAAAPLSSSVSPLSLSSSYSSLMSFVRPSYVVMLYLSSTSTRKLSIWICTICCRNFQGGIYIFQLADWYFSAFALLVGSFLECLSICWIYGELINDFNFKGTMMVKFITQYSNPIIRSCTIVIKQ